MIREAYMGWMPAQVRHSNLLKPVEKLLYCQLTAITGTEGWCLAGYTELAEFLSCTEATVKGYLSSLEKCGFISMSDSSKDEKVRIWLKTK